MKKTLKRQGVGIAWNFQNELSGFTTAIRGRLPVDPGRANLGVLGRPSAPQSASKSDPKFTQCFDRILNAFWGPFVIKNRSKQGGPKRGNGSFATTARRKRPGVPPEPQNERPRPPQDPKMDIQGCPQERPNGPCWHS